MNTSQARAIDPILTAIARGYESQFPLVANILFPIVPVNARGGTIITFGREQFQVVDTRRAPGADTKSVEIGYGSGKYSLTDNRLMGKVPVEHMEEAAAVPGIDLASRAIVVVQDKMSLEREVHAASLARSESAYVTANKTTLSGADLWTASTSNPFAVIEVGKEAVRKKIGRRPNVMVLGPVVLSALRMHPLVLDKLSTATDRTPATLLQLAALFEIATIVEGNAIVDTGGTFGDVWGNDAVLAYVTPKSLQEMGSQNYGYTYQLSGRPDVEEAYLDRRKNSFMYPVSDASQAVLTSADSGYLIKNAVTA
ncbi:MAG: major capsid protein [Xanthomonadaceae bacterium]|nr:major capsid protein [Xanthomonadaceae bacterium]MBH2008131.1 major capsid protein [Xanthomonadaceae bacterium]